MNLTKKNFHLTRRAAAFGAAAGARPRLTPLSATRVYDSRHILSRAPTGNA